MAGSSLVQRVVVLGAASLLALFAQAGDAWKDKPPGQWTVEEALQVVQNSPWAHQEFLASPRFQAGTHITASVTLSEKGRTDQRPRGLEGGRAGGPDPPDPLGPPWEPSPEDFTLAAYLVRWESAAPVAAAFARLEELGETVSAAFQAPTPRRPVDRYVVSVKTLAPPSRGPNLFDGLTDSALRDRARLATAAGTVLPLEVERSGTGAAAAVHFFFPRLHNGRPLLRADREVVRFSFVAPTLTLKSKFTLERKLLQ